MPAPGRTPNDVDIEYIKANYRPGSIECIAKELGLTEKVISTLVRQMGLKKPRRLWTDQEIQFIQDNYVSLP